MDEQKPEEFSSTETPAEQPKELVKLSPEDEAVLAKKRVTFRALKEVFDEEDIYSFQAVVDGFRAVVNGAYEAYQHKVLMPDLHLQSKSTDEKITAQVDRLLETLKETSVWDTLNYLQALCNAVDHETYEKTKDWKVKDLDITLL